MRTIGRYSLHDEIASGGMATVFLARQHGEQGFSRVVAVKMLHAQYAKEEAFRAMFLDEARLVSRIRHPNVVATLDVLEDGGNLLLVMEYVHGASLTGLLKSSHDTAQAVPAPIAAAILGDVLEGLHAAHEAKSEEGAPLGIVHRDVSPQNVLVGIDGVAKIADFGIAKAAGRLAEKFSVHHTVKGKAGYMAPEQIRGRVDRRTDVYGAGVVLWETLTGMPLYTGESFLEIVAKSLDGNVEPPSRKRPGLGAAWDALVAKALAHHATDRYASARDMAIALERCVPRASPREVGEWVEETERVRLLERARQIARIESGRAEMEERPTILDPLARVASVTSGGVSLSGAVTRRVRRRTASRRLVVAMGGLVCAVGAAAAVRVSYDRASGRATGSSIDAPAPAATAPEASEEVRGAAPVASSTEPFVAATPAAPPAASPHVATPPRPLRRLPPKRPAAAAGAASPSSAECHWEQLPDEQGILIPKKVCP